MRGLEEQDYLDDPDNPEECDMSTILELDPDPAVYIGLDAPRAYARTDPRDPHSQVVTFDGTEEYKVSHSRGRKR